MKRLQFRYNIYIVLVAFITTASACKKFVDIEPAPNLIATEDIFKSEKTAAAAVASVYAQMRTLNTNMTNGGLSIFGGLCADEIRNTSSTSSYDPFLNNSLLSNTTSIQTNFWRPAYVCIYKINAVLEGLENSSAIKPTVKNQWLGEMKMARAFHYFYLTNLFGDVPLVTATDYKINAIMPRTPSDEIYTQIVSDLTEAEDQLGESYPSAGKARPNRLTAIALLARVYLYLGEWAKAEQMASSVIESGTYHLNNNLDNVFLANSEETIWELTGTDETGNTAQGANYVPSSSTSRPAFALTDDLLNIFDPLDQRKAKWTKTNINGGVAYTFPFKYKQRLSSGPVLEANIVFRLAELYLIRAEARAQQEKISGSVSAEEDINAIRNRAGLDNTLAVTKDEMLDAIEQERRFELFTEWGDRWFNLKRTNRADSILSVLKAPYWQATDKLFPIPLAQIESNPFLTQNPGYD